MNRNDLIIVVVLPVAAALVGLVFGVALPRWKKRRLRSIPIVVAGFEESTLVPPRPARVTPAPRRAQADVEPGSPFPSQPAVGSGASQADSAPAATVTPLRPAAARGNLAVVSSVDAGAAPGDPAPLAQRPPVESARPRLEMITAETAAQAQVRPASLRPRPPMEGTLQFLPGRLEIVEGRDVGQEVRFVRQPGAPTTEITFGRMEGEPYRHVQLHEPTVSRLHAKLTLEDRQWRLTNLSGTNPVVVNSAPMEGVDASLVLSEGDRIEMGEVVFRFRSK